MAQYCAEEHTKPLDIKTIENEMKMEIGDIHTFLFIQLEIHAIWWDGNGIEFELLYIKRKKKANKFGKRTDEKKE